MRWHFPLINPNLRFSLKHYFDHVKEELKEYEAEPEGSIEQAKEVVDVLHSAETLVRKFFERNPQHNFDDIKARTVEKNRARGYYNE
jgi:hypothetical protein